jgi:hypothetical protein
LKEPDDPFKYILPDIETTEQKNVLKSKLEKGTVNDKIPPPILKTYLGLTIETILEYK